MTLKKTVSRFRRSALAAAVSVAATPLFAAPALEEVIVTATLRAASLQACPGNVQTSIFSKCLQNIAKVFGNALPTQF